MMSKYTFSYEKIEREHFSDEKIGKRNEKSKWLLSPHGLSAQGSNSQSFFFFLQLILHCFRMFSQGSHTDNFRQPLANTGGSALFKDLHTSNNYLKSKLTLGYFKKQ